MTLSEELTWRGFVNQTTLKDISQLDGEPINFYWGVDPSAASMTVGNLAAAMMVKCFLRHGHKAYLLVGGATGLVGDPDGKANERDLITNEQVDQNKQAIVSQYETIFGGQSFETVDNYDWFKDVAYLDFLRDVGKNVPMRQMMARDFVQTRLSESGAGISYAEFSYVLIQAYDFLELYNKHEVTLQVCGSDQWGNSIAGVDLIRRKTGAEAHVFSAPLIVDKSTGQKFGKSEDGAIWLDPAQTSPYKFYQFWLNVDDQSAADYLKIFTEFDKGQVDQIMDEFNQNRGGRALQKSLALEVTKLIHGQAAAEDQKRIAEALFGGDKLDLSADDFVILEKELPTASIDRKFDTEMVVNALAETTLASSKGEARQFISSGAIYVNNEKLTDGYVLDADHKSVVMRRGKNSVAVLKINN